MTVSMCRRCCYKKTLIVKSGKVCRLGGIVTGDGVSTGATAERIIDGRRDFLAVNGVFIAQYVVH